MNGRGNVTDIQVYCQSGLLSYHERAIHFRRKEVNLIRAQDSRVTFRDPEGNARNCYFGKATPGSTEGSNSAGRKIFTTEGTEEIPGESEQCQTFHPNPLQVSDDERLLFY
jgi:hypothetical protein